MKRSLAILALFFGFTAQGANAAGEFDLAPYLEKCGGKLYSKCDSEDINQETVFEAARAEAVKSGRDVMVVVGADWCGACRTFADMLSKDADAPKLHARVLMVKLNGDLRSTKAVAAKLNVSYLGYPQAFIVKTAANEVVQQFYPSAYGSVAEIMKILGAQPEESVKERPTYLDRVLVSTLELPIDLNTDYGHSTFIKRPRNDAEKYVNQGIAALQVYHYVDAYRSFRAAELLKSDSIMALVGLALAALQIDSYSGNGEYFANEALAKVDTVRESRALTAQEAAWVDFAKSYLMANVTNYVKRPGDRIRPLLDAYNQILSVDKSNLDGHSLVTWYLIGTLDLDDAKARFESILKELPDNIGAHHSLLHIAEILNNPRVANEHALKLIALAPRSAHAQHMYGHTLPQRGMWAEALEQFKKADELHLQWAMGNAVDPNQDWHYAHNLDLMAAAYLGIGRFDLARETWATAVWDGRAILHALQAAVATAEFSDAVKALGYYEYLGWTEILKPLRSELELTTETAAAVSASLPDEEGFSQILKKVLNSYVASKSLDAPTSKAVSAYFASQFLNGGFDGWSNAYLELLRLKRVAKILSLDSLTQLVVPLEFSARAGSICGGSEKEKSLVRCVE